MTKTSTYPLRLPRSVKAAVEVLAREEGISVNQFVATAVAEKLSAMRTAEFFEERRRRASLGELTRLLGRVGGPPRATATNETPLRLLPDRRGVSITIRPPRPSPRARLLRYKAVCNRVQ